MHNAEFAFKVAATSNGTFITITYLIQ